MPTTAHARDRMTAKVQQYLDEFILECQSRPADKQREIANVLLHCTECTQRCWGIDRCPHASSPPIK
jgi:hypothetical protein